MKSKEDKILSLFFNYPTKYWHFKDIKNATGMSDSKIAGWLNILRKEKIILKYSAKGKMSYYTGNHESLDYADKKKAYSIALLHNSGLIKHLLSLDYAKTIIIFGSFIQSDWYNESDIDIFIYGNERQFDRYGYSSKLNREIQVFSAQDRKDFEKFGQGLINNMISGYLVKGTLDFLEITCILPKSDLKNRMKNV